jgi:hypothetical protein
MDDDDTDLQETYADMEKSALSRMEGEAIGDVSI